MIIRLLKTASDRATIRKVVTDPLELDVSFKRDLDVLNPAIDLLIGEVDYKDYNYLEIPDLGRFYFIDFVEYVNNRINRLNCSCDYLETYREGILNSTGLVKKEIKSGDFGELTLDKTGFDITERFISDVVLEPSDKLVMTVLGGK